MVQVLRPARFAEKLPNARPSVVFRLIVEDFKRGLVVEASLVGSVVVLDEALQEGLSVVCAEDVCPVARVVADFGQGARGFGQAAAHDPGDVVQA